MRRLVWTLIPIALVAGAVLGYELRGEQTKTTTVVQVITTASPPPATHHLAAIVQGVKGACLSTSATYQAITSHTFTLRRPGNGLTNGDVVGVALSAAMDNAGCNLDVNFSIGPSLGFFMVNDDSTTDSWGPFDSHQMAAHLWTVRLNESS